MEGACLVRYNVTPSCATEPNVNSILAREFNSKAAKAIWDLNGILSPLYPQRRLF